MKRILIIILAVASLASCGDSKQKKTSTKQTKEKFELKDGLYAKFITSTGEYTAKLEMEKAPLTVANFVALAEGDMPNNVRELGVPFYDGLTYHRVISRPNGDPDDFMVQGGDPAGNGSGGPGYQFRDEFHPDLKHAPGVLSMANSGPGTNGSQFFICVSTPSHLDGKHSVFGVLVDGYDPMYRTKQYDIIKHIEIIRIGKAANEFNAMETFNSLK